MQEQQEKEQEDFNVFLYCERPTLRTNVEKGNPAPRIIIQPCTAWHLKPQSSSKFRVSSFAPPSSLRSIVHCPSSMVPVQFQVSRPSSPRRPSPFLPFALSPFRRVAPPSSLPPAVCRLPPGVPPSPPCRRVVPSPFRPFAIFCSVPSLRISQFPFSTSVMQPGSPQNTSA